MKTLTLTAERLRALVHYDPETGIFTRNGKEVKTRNSAGYIVLTIDWVQHSAHRLAWLYVKGEWPKGDIDHKDRVRSNNRFANLRECNDSQNKGNTAVWRSNTSGFKGVTWNKNGNKWQAGIKHMGRSSHLGLYDCPVAAHLAYVVAADRQYGEFARAA